MTMVDERPVGSEDDLDLDELPDGPDGPDGPPHEAEESPFRRWRSNLPLLIIIVLAWMVAAGAVVLWHQNQDLRADRDDRQDASRVAADFTTAVLSYDHRDLQGSVEDVMALSTTDWGRQYQDAWFQEQQPIVEATRARAEVAVDEVMLGDESNGVVPAVVRFNATIHSEVGTRRLQGGYLQVDLTMEDGHWKVDDMRYLATQDQSLDPNTAGGNGDPAADASGAG